MIIQLNYNFFDYESFHEYCHTLFPKGFPSITFDDLNEISNSDNQSEFIKNLRSLLNVNLLTEEEEIHDCITLIIHLSDIKYTVNCSHQATRTLEFNKIDPMFDIHRDWESIDSENNYFEKERPVTIEYYQKCFKFKSFLDNTIAPIVRTHKYPYTAIDSKKILQIIDLLYDQKITFPIAKIVSNQIFETSLWPSEIIEIMGLVKTKDENILMPFIIDTIKKYPDQVSNFVEHNDKKSLGFLISSILKQTNDKGDLHSIMVLTKLKLAEYKKINQSV